jgi:PTS system ascorbate-specific IIA component
MEEGLVEDLLGVKTMADFEMVMEKYDQKESRD